jgi:prepilin-type N-terminal cleavage/methylation domain-containing protein
VTSAAACRRGQRGFTLLELLITLGVTTIGLVGLLALHLSVARGNDGASRSADAEQLCASKVEALRGLRIADLMTEINGNPALVLPSYQPALPWPPPLASRIFVLGRNAVPYSVSIALTPVAGAALANLMKIRVVVEWSEDGGTLGANGGTLDHAIALEVLRTLEENL